MAGGQIFPLPPPPPQPPATTPNQLPIMFSYLTSSPNTFSQSILYGIPESPLSGLPDYHFRFSTSLSLPPFNWPTHNTFSQSILYGIPESPLSGLAKVPPPRAAGQDHWSVASLVPWPDNFISSMRLTLWDTPPPPLGSRCATWFGSVDSNFSFLVLTIPPPVFTDQPLTLSLRVSSMVSPSLHCQDWSVLLFLSNPKHYDTSPPRLSARHVVWERTYFPHF